MTSRRQSWSVLVAEQRNNQVLRHADVMIDGDRTLRNIQGIVISIETPLMQNTCGLKKRKDIRRYNWYTHNEMPRI